MLKACQRDGFRVQDLNPITKIAVQALLCEIVKIFSSCRYIPLAAYPELIAQVSRKSQLSEKVKIHSATSAIE